MLNLNTQIIGETGKFQIKDVSGVAVAGAFATILHKSHPVYEDAWIAFGEALRDNEKSSLSADEKRVAAKMIQADFLCKIIKRIDGVGIDGKEIGADSDLIKEALTRQGLQWLSEQFFAALNNNSIFLLPTKPKKEPKKRLDFAQDSSDSAGE